MPAKSTRRPARYSKKVPPKRTGSLGGATPLVLGGVTILIATAAILAFVLLGGGDDEEPTPTATAVAQAAPTDAEMPAGVLQVVPEAVGPPLTVLPTGSTYVLGPSASGSVWSTSTTNRSRSAGSSGSS